MLSHRFTTSYAWVVCITATLLLLTLLCIKQSVELRQMRRQHTTLQNSLTQYQQQSSGMVLSLNADLATIRRENAALRARLASSKSGETTFPSRTP